MEFVSQFKSFFRLSVYVLLSLTLGASSHEYYLSIANLTFDKEDKALEMSVWYFNDDLLYALRQEVNQEIEWDDDMNKLEVVLSTYLNKHIYIKGLDSKKMQFQWVGMKFKGELVYVYLKCPMDEIADLELYNSVLLDYFEGQKNIVHFKSENLKQSFYFDKKKSKVNLRAQ
jgi:hypothetical protein